MNCFVLLVLFGQPATYKYSTVHVEDGEDKVVLLGPSHHIHEEKGSLLDTVGTHPVIDAIHIVMQGNGGFLGGTQMKQPPSIMTFSVFQLGSKVFLVKLNILLKKQSTLLKAELVGFHVAC